jgi:hypothetical protein
MLFFVSRRFGKQLETETIIKQQEIVIEQDFDIRKIKRPYYEQALAIISKKKTEDPKTN